MNIEAPSACNRFCAQIYCLIKQTVSAQKRFHMATQLFTFQNLLESVQQTSNPLNYLLLLHLKVLWSLTQENVKS